MDDWEFDLNYEEVEDCEWCQRNEAQGLYDLDGVETGMCAECAEDNDAARVL